MSGRPNEDAIASIGASTGAPTAAPVAPLDAEANELLRERYYLGVDQTAMAGTIAVGTIIAMLWNQSSQIGLIIWGALMAVALPTPMVVKRLSIPFDRWFRLLAPHEFVLGAMWGSIALLGMPRTPTWQALLGTILVAIVLAGSISSSQFTRAYVSYTGTFVACCVAGYAIHGVGQARLLLWVFAVTWAYGIVLASEQRTLQIDLVRSLQENRKLVTTLESANAEALVANEKLTEAVEKSDLLARTDPLTRLANRMQFDEELERQLTALRAGHSRYLSLAYIDLDNFKYVNDTHGHKAGDQLLVAVARRLRAVKRAGETIARVGGDELVLITRAYDPTEIGTRLASVFEEPFSIAGGPFELGASIGVATTSKAIPRDELMRRADSAQYTAKRNGGNAYQIFSSNLPSGPPGWMP